MRQRAAHWLAWWLALIVLWQLFVNTFLASEVIAGVAAAAVAATAAELVRGQGLVHFHFRLRWLLQAGRLPRGVILDSWTLATVLWRRTVRGERIHGDFEAVPFESGGDDARSSARRALYVAAISLTPNTIVVGIDREDDTMLVHELVPSGPAGASELVSK